MSLSANTVWEVRTAGSDNNGGGFVAGATGTDRSQAALSFANGTNLTVDAATNTDVAPDGYTPVAADVGNIIQITTTGGGGAFTVGFYQILSIQSGKWRLDRSPAATGSSGATWAMGGALATISKLAGAMVASNKAFIKSGAYTYTASNTFAQSGVTPSNSAFPTRLIGYASSRGDIRQTAPGTWANNSSRPTLTAQTNTGIDSIKLNNSGWIVENLIIDCGNLGTSRGIYFTGAWTEIRNCKISNFKNEGIRPEGSESAVTDCEVTAGASGATAAIFVNANGVVVERCNVHDNACSGIRNTTTPGVIAFNLVTNNTGATSDGIQINGGGRVRCLNNTVYGSGRHGINNTSTNAITPLIRGNILEGNGGYGNVGASASGLPADPMYDGNAYYNNTSGTRSNMDDTSGVNGVAPYTNALDVILTASAFTNAPGGDFSLNNAVGGGAALRGTAFPGALPGVSQVGYMDFGALQVQEPTPGGGAPIIGSSIVRGVV